MDDAITQHTMQSEFNLLELFTSQGLYRVPSQLLDVHSTYRLQGFFRSVLSTEGQPCSVQAVSNPLGITGIAIDPRPIFALAEQLFPNKGTALGNAWRTRQCEYTWLRSVAQRYADFWKVTEDALVFAAHMMR